MQTWAAKAIGVSVTSLITIASALVSELTEIVYGVIQYEVSWLLLLSQPVIDRRRMVRVVGDVAFN